ncbi:hypothetical protein ACFVUW_04000 [Streptomyces xiamenensis]|uniref:hypothetical protein n=1 Tax=Streptomyces xiamenensis TaxID=408015 RepID=UPI0036E1CB9D
MVVVSVLLWVSPVVFTGSVLTLVVQLARRLLPGGLPRVPSAKPLVLVAVLALSGAGTLYAHAVRTYAGGFVFPDTVCLFGLGVDEPPESRRSLPLGVVCRGTEMVPGWVNPALYALLVLGTLSLTAAAVYASTRPDRKSSQV